MSRLRHYCTVRNVATVLVTLCTLPAIGSYPFITLAAAGICVATLFTREEEG